MKLAVASGKGGTGKTTVAVHLALVLESQRVQLLDCDVENPNAALFLKGTLIRKEPIFLPFPSINQELCTSCGRCTRLCAFGALAKVNAHIILFEEHCHACGGCIKVCPPGAITSRNRAVAQLQHYQCGHVDLLEATMDIGLTLSPHVIRYLKGTAAPHLITILDAPPGTACPVVATLEGVDFVLLVTEPTPFGFHDLKLMTQLVREMDLPFAVVINKAGIGNDAVYRFCRANQIPILAELPYDERVAEQYAKGNVLIDSVPGFQSRFRQLSAALMRELGKITSSSNN